MDGATLTGGFTDPARDSAEAFRAIMTAMARPGTIHRLCGAHGPVSDAAACVLLTLCDPDTPVWLAPSVDSSDLRAWLAFHTGAPLAEPATAVFALGRWGEFPLEAFPVGTPAYPDRSTTLIVEMDDLRPEGATLAGPGIETTAALALPETAFFRANAARFPLGLDTIFTAGDRVAALPRTTEVR